jgi:uncharacterized protein
MEFEWDEAKDVANRAKHGVSLGEAALLDWQLGVTRPDDRRSYQELRYIRYALLNGRLHTCAFTYRLDTIRIISLRKSNRRETVKYGQTETNTND